jgi:hypothetical protein
MTESNQVVIGLRARTGRAIAVVLAGTADGPRVVKKLEIKLVDPKIPATFQPYHEVMELPWADGQKAVRVYTRAIEVVARKAVTTLIKELQSAGMTVTGVGVVGSKDRDLARIGNYHIRAHAAEGILFRRVLELAAEAHKLRTRTFSDRELGQSSLIELKTSSVQMKNELKALGRWLVPPWRTDEKQAATAAWLMLPGNRG